MRAQDRFSDQFLVHVSLVRRRSHFHWFHFGTHTKLCLLLLPKFELLWHSNTSFEVISTFKVIFDAAWLSDYILFFPAWKIRDPNHRLLLSLLNSIIIIKYRQKRHKTFKTLPDHTSDQVLSLGHTERLQGHTRMDQKKIRKDRLGDRRFYKLQIRWIRRHFSSNATAYKGNYDTMAQIFLLR